MQHDEETGVRLARGVGKQMDAHVRDEGQDALRAMRQANTKERTTGRTPKKMGAKVDMGVVCRANAVALLTVTRVKVGGWKASCQATCAY